MSGPGKQSKENNVFLPYLEKIGKTATWLAKETGSPKGSVSEWGRLHS